MFRMQVKKSLRFEHQPSAYVDTTNFVCAPFEIDVTLRHRGSAPAVNLHLKQFHNHHSPHTHSKEDLLQATPQQA